MQKFSFLKDHVMDFIDKKVFNLDDNFSEHLIELKRLFEKFDLAYARYENFYVFELMVIEQDSRRFIIDSIKIEHELEEIEW